MDGTDKISITKTEKVQINPHNQSNKDQSKMERNSDKKHNGSTNQNQTIVVTQKKENKRAETRTEGEKIQKKTQ